ncbi:hypothetical protein [Bifidobacterium crudilactis]|uniref:hypothetical protein n=1 Tax=Bifidobacterium crudilactis TaxID=327277 RepID=UPI0026479091|nr:hypothetical protein [Bifidobacterium crudilactis]MDN5971838.1 hypothetical protein [Bifidobacterium crudilactis]MDN6001142.1 hypothetical protein [Bifidobacterium crudilactis]MDN6466682.1 hypothetical protein [Bifidobacterium crudilactis]MDN6558099.1 hypothetical protein [Bifidobacterium crudilactis]MDN6773453.1 hypothetical protein [Bifidobacterium crudilactis]
MTQEYTPDTDDAIDLIVAGIGRVNQLGLAPVGYPRTATDAVEAAKRWIAEIRAEAWGEGHVRGWMDGVENAEPASPNPYRKENYLYKSNGLQREENQQ